MTGGEPQFLELVPHVGIHSSTEVAREVRGADEAEDVGKILKSVGRGHARGELHLDEPGKRDDPILRARDRGLSWIGERNRLGLSVAGKVSGNEKIDLHVVGGVPDRLASWPDVYVAASEPLGLEADEILAPNQDIHIDGQALEPMLGQGY